MFDPFEEALRSTGAQAKLVLLVKKWSAQGRTQRQIYDDFEEFRAFLRAANRKADEDIVMDVMDRIVGWCSPEQCLFDHYLSDDPDAATLA